MSGDAVAPARYRGPVALGDDLRRFWSLTYTLAATDFKLRFFGSALGYVWTLARPFAFFGVVYFVFTEIANVGDAVKNYGVYILYGLVLFGFFAETTGACVTSLIARENLLRKMRFPRIVVPLSVVLTALFNLGMTMVAVFIFTIANGIWPTWSWLELVPLVALLALLATGVGMLLSVLFIRFRDVQPIWEVGTQMLFYASPVLYVATMVPENIQRPYLSNPIAAILTQVRHAIVDPTAPSLATAIGDPIRMLVPLGVVALAFGLGLYVFVRRASRIVEEL
jgi:ABC-2 type transport system permease protein